MEIEYTPKQPEQKAPQSSYVLVNDLTGKPPPKRGPQTLKAITYDKKKNRVEVEFKTPFPPRDNCKKCFGRGYVGLLPVKDQYAVVICQKCFPMVKQNEQSIG